ncbi:hypothetical protein QR46_4933 [Giardia duodenalis assemblage B]|uniref:EGF-like domain-containing protein n=1 Tax=Giardia duodenalis assemblage B TaxID=1394984 RepID=A0A132NM19_GIAIN|nr:hypothetical protein QR46_4933 [Giardia intestinalis assemblage B]
MAGAPIDSFCRPSSSPQAITAGCTADASAGVCGSCSGGFFLFRGGCYKAGQEPGSEICMAVEGGKCTACNAANGLFQNPAASPTLGSECILCWDTTGADGYKGVVGCNTCTAPQQTGAATCNTCQAGYVKATSTNECKPCGTGCSACSASNQQECTACLEGKYLKSDSHTCVDGTGDTCGQGKYADPTTNECKSCATDIPECTACTYSDTLQKPVCSACGGSKPLLKTAIDGTTTCVDDTGCAVGNTHIVDNAKCLRCGDDANGGLAGCNTCSSKTTCTTCQDGYVKNNGGSACESCGSNCATCTKTNDMSTCTGCLPGFFLKTDGSNKECVPCDNVDKGGIEGCATCTFSGSLTCNSCKPNYRQSGSNPVTCTRTCEDETACGGTAGACDAIVIGANGEMKYYCSYCGESTKFPIDGICKGDSDKAGNTCAGGACQSCAANYFLYMGGCYNTQATPGNLMCKTAPNGFCTAAANSRYFAVPGAAKTDQSVLAYENPLGTTTGSNSDINAYVGVEGCKTCEAPTAATGMASAKCTACDEGKVLTGSGYGCVTCDIAGCSACKADNMCEACGDGYRLEGEACVSTGGGNLSTAAIAGISVAAVVVVGGLVGFLC